MLRRQHCLRQDHEPTDVFGSFCYSPWKVTQRTRSVHVANIDAIVEGLRQENK